MRVRGIGAMPPAAALAEVTTNVRQPSVRADGVHFWGWVRLDCALPARLPTNSRTGARAGGRARDADGEARVQPGAAGLHGDGRGKHFLQLVTVGVESSRGPKFPLGRILWSVQVDLVLLLAGAGGFRPLHRLGGGVTRCMLDEWRIHRKRARRMRHPRTEDLTNETLV